METRDILFRLDEPDTNYYLIESKIREGNSFLKNDILYSIKSINRITKKSRIIHIRAEEDGKQLQDYCAISGTEIEPGMIICQLKMCSHGIIIMGLCSTCGKKMNKVDSHKKVVLGGLNKTLHLSQDEFKRWRMKHNQKLLSNKKLVLVLDLDNTLLETFCLHGAPSKKSEKSLFVNTHHFIPFNSLKSVKDYKNRNSFSGSNTPDFSNTPLLGTFRESQEIIIKKPKQLDPSTESISPIKPGLNVNPADSQNYKIETEEEKLSESISRLNPNPFLVTSSLNKGYLCFKTENKQHLQNLKISQLLNYTEKQELMAYMERNNHVQTFTIENDSKSTYFIKTRPFIKQLICLLAPKYNLFVYTLGRRDYANKALNILGLDKMISPDSVVCAEDNADIAHKELTRLVQCDDHFVVVLDDRSDIWHNNLRNLIRVKNYSYWKELIIKYRMYLDSEARDLSTFEKSLHENDLKEERNVKKIATELETLYENIYKDFNLEKLSGAENDKIMEGFDVRPHLDFMKKDLFKGLTFFVIAQKILKTQIEEMIIHGANVVSELNMKTIREVDFIIVLRLDLVSRGLAYTSLSINELEWLRNELEHEEGVVSRKFVSYAWVEDSIGEMEKRSIDEYIVKSGIIRNLALESVEIKKTVQDGNYGELKEEGVKIMKSKEVEDREDCEHKLTKELEDELEIDHMLM